MAVTAISLAADQRLLEGKKVKAAAYTIPSEHGVVTGITVLDIGCGGGLLAEPLAYLGAVVTGKQPWTTVQLSWLTLGHACRH